MTRRAGAFSTFDVASALGPTFVALVAWLAGSVGPSGRFAALAAGLLVASALAAWGVALVTRPGVGRRVVAIVVGVAVLVAVTTALGAANPFAAIGMTLAVVFAAGAFAALSRACGLPSAAAGAVGCGLVVVASTGLFWADAFAERFDADVRGLVRREVVAADPSLAIAYGLAGHDRLHESGVYGRVPLAASTIELPTTGGVAGRFALAGVAAIAIAAVLARRRAEGRSPGEAG